MAAVGLFTMKNTEYQTRLNIIFGTLFGTTLLIGLIAESIEVSSLKTYWKSEWCFFTTQEIGQLRFYVTFLTPFFFGNYRSRLLASVDYFQILQVLCYERTTH